MYRTLRIIELAALELNEEDVLKRDNLGWAAINASQVQFVLLEAIQDISQCARRFVIDCEGHKAFARRK